MISGIGCQAITFQHVHLNQNLKLNSRVLGEQYSLTHHHAARIRLHLLAFTLTEALTKNYAQLETARQLEVLFKDPIMAAWQCRHLNA